MAPSRRQHVISSLILRYDGVVFSMIKEYIDNGDATPAREWDIADGAMWYTRSSIELAPVFDNRVEGLIRKITSDDFEIPLVPAGDLMPIPGSYETARAEIVFDGEQCTFTGPDVAIGTVIDVDFVNNSTTPAFVALGSDFSIEVPARARGRNHGQVLMLADTLLFRCAQLGQGLLGIHQSGRDADDLGLERGHHTLRVRRKGGNTIAAQLAPRTASTVYLANEERDEGPIFTADTGERINRHAAPASCVASPNTPG